MEDIYYDIGQQVVLQDKPLVRVNDNLRAGLIGTVVSVGRGELDVRIDGNIWRFPVDHWMPL